MLYKEPYGAKIAAEKKLQLKNHRIKMISNNTR